MSYRVNRHLPATAERTRFGVVDVHIGSVPAPDKGRPLQLVLTLRHRTHPQTKHRLRNRNDGYSIPAAAVPASHSHPSLSGIRRRRRVRLDAENGPAAQAVCGEAGVIRNAGTAIRAGGMSVFRHDRCGRACNICREQFIAAALTYGVEIVVAGLLQDVLKGTRHGTRFGFLLQNLSKLKSIAIGNIDSRQLTHIGPPIS